jgi:hypothetical protein
VDLKPTFDSCCYFSFSRPGIGDVQACNFTEIFDSSIYRGLKLEGAKNTSLLHINFFNITQNSDEGDRSSLLMTYRLPDSFYQFVNFISIIGEFEAYPLIQFWRSSDTRHFHLGNIYIINCKFANLICHPGEKDFFDVYILGPIYCYRLESYTFRAKWDSTIEIFNTLRTLDLASSMFPVEGIEQMVKIYSEGYKVQKEDFICTRPSPSHTLPPVEETELSSGEITGIIIDSIVGAFLLGLGIFCVIQKLKSPKVKVSSPSTSSVDNTIAE